MSFNNSGLTFLITESLSIVCFVVVSVFSKSFLTLTGHSDLCCTSYSSSAVSKMFNFTDGVKTRYVLVFNKFCTASKGFSLVGYSSVVYSAFKRVTPRTVIA